jgi:hypothetical protein
MFAIGLYIFYTVTVFAHTNTTDHSISNYLHEIIEEHSLFCRTVTKEQCFETQTVRVFATDIFTRQSKKQTQVAVPLTYSQSNVSLRRGRQQGTFTALQNGMK